MQFTIVALVLLICVFKDKISQGKGTDAYGNHKVIRNQHYGSFCEMIIIQYANS